MNRRVLFVDDEPHVLDALRRPLHQQFEVTVATNPVAALQLIVEQSEFAVIVSDMRMPQLSGVEFLAEVRKRKPDSTRVMLTGNQDQATAAAAVNDGAVFRFLNKPCNIPRLTSVLEDAVRQHQLVTAERELLNRTLQGSIRVLVEALSIAKPEIFGSADRLERHCSELAQDLDDVEPWEMRAAARLAFLGCVGMAEDTLQSVLSGETINEHERAEYHQHPEIGSKLIADLPRLGGVSQIIRYQQKNYDGSGTPRDVVAGKDIPVGARILHIVQAYDILQSKGNGDADALAILGTREGAFDPSLLTKFVTFRAAQVPALLRVRPNALRLGSTIAEDVVSTRGVLLVGRGQRVTAPITRHLENYALLNLLPETILVSA